MLPRTACRIPDSWRNGSARPRVAVDVVPGVAQRLVTETPIPTAGSVTFAGREPRAKIAIRLAEEAADGLPIRLLGLGIPQRRCLRPQRRGSCHLRAWRLVQQSI